MNKNHTTEKRGYALVTVLGIMAVLAIIFTMLLQSSSQSVHIGDILADRTRAAAYAEAGVEYAYAILRDDYSKRSEMSNFMSTTNCTLDGVSVQTEYGEGTYTIKLTEKSDGQYVLINSIGVSGVSTVEVEAVCEDSNYATDSGFDYGIFAGGGNVTHRSGGGTVIDADGNLNGMHFNGSLNNNGNTDTKANVSVGGTITKPSAVTGTVAENQPMKNTPKLEERYNSFAWYQQNANTTVNGSYSLGRNRTASIGGNGILFVNGDVSIKGTFNGTIIATGNITIQGSVVASDEGIAVATQNGDIQFNTQANNYGLFYTETGSFYQRAQGTVYGQIVIGGEFSSTGGSDITMPAGEDAGENVPNPVIAAWQK